ncbi:hypothetical protein HNQ77_001911 [Silvibacterium bohemicum]|uniref:Uncharacterized protein n=1 Tax=Silvibacterium bohemicum TaxID=1577686 RepID=A0A841JRE1_9BACT|nr:hypothetical protein [Silvibacterium bohemicum]MBB6143962.1 hypothetical protein [Silvibacterium bohemicum]
MLTKQDLEKFFRSRLFSYIFGSVACALSIIAALIGLPRSVFLGFTVASILTTFLSIASFLYVLHSTIDDTKESGEQLKDEVKQLSDEVHQFTDGVKCFPVGSNEDAVRYVLDLCNTNKIKSIRDTHARHGDRPDPYQDKTYEELERGLRAFLSRDPDAHLFLIVGSSFDLEFMKVLASLAKDKEMNERKLCLRKLRGNVPMMSALILEYKDKTEEVLFGWGNRMDGDKESVFRSSHKDLVAQFKSYYQVLENTSDRVAVAEVLSAASTTSLFVPKHFWHRHTSNTYKNTIVYTEPLCFRLFDGDTRIFIRDVDLNGSATPKDLKDKIPWLANHDLKPSRAYIPGGESFAKDDLQEWLQKNGLPLCFTMVSRNIHWDPNGPVTNSNLIVMGSVRTNSAVMHLREDAGYGDRFRYWHEPNGVSILDPTPAENERLLRRKKTITPLGRTLLSEDWSTESLVLVTRGKFIDSSRTMTLILANQGRGIQCVMSKCLTNETYRWDAWAREFKDCNFPDSLPDEFQMLFHVKLDPDEEESRCIRMTPLLYSGVSQP